MGSNDFIQRSLSRFFILIVLNIYFYIKAYINSYYKVYQQLFCGSWLPQTQAPYVLLFCWIQPYILICVYNKLLQQFVSIYKLKYLVGVLQINVVGQLCSTILKRIINIQWFEIGQRPGLQRALFCFLRRQNVIFRRLNKVYIIGSTFITYIGGRFIK